MRFAQSGPQIDFSDWGEYQMDVNIHQAPVETRSVGGVYSLRDQPEIFAPVVVGKEDRQAPLPRWVT